MKYRKFEINNYRGVEHAYLAVSNNLIPLVGINESGKTTVLQALLCFDRHSDRYGGGKHLVYKNRYQIGTSPSSITAWAEVEDEDDLRRIARSLRLSPTNSLFDPLRATIGTSTIEVRRDLATRTYSLPSLPIPENVPDEKRNALARAIYRHLPFLLYFDDFTDRIPGVISFRESSKRRKGYRLRSPSLGAWESILEEVFKRGNTDEGFSLKDFVGMSDAGDQRGVLSDINDCLNSEVISRWKELRLTSPELADDPADLELKLDYEKVLAGFRFTFSVEDRSTGSRRYFAVAERSKGFQWFFNFQMRLLFNPKYKGVHSGAVYLLDEPGSYLHSSGQEKLLETLAKIAKTNSIIYCTHSQHLLSPEFVNIGQAKIVEKEYGKVEMISVGDSGASRHQGALTPIFDALRLRTGAFNREMKRVVITEGIVDFYAVTSLRRFRREWELAGVDLIPGAGADQLRDLISLAIAWSDGYRVLFDGDRAGKRAAGRYRAFFGPEQASNFIHYTGAGANTKLEGLFSAKDRERLSEISGIADTKAALIGLQFSDLVERRRFWSKLDRETLGNLEPVRVQLSALAKPGEE